LSRLEETSLAQRQEITMLHGHYIAMGGIAVDTRDTPEIFVSNHSKVRFLTYEGLKELLDRRPDLISDLSKGEIQDKSKANGFAKLLVCLQAIWFCTQVIVRIATGLTISILELNTFAHALCTLLLYCFWWDKPLDVSEPTFIPVSVALSEFALLSVLDCSGFEATEYCPSQPPLWSVSRTSTVRAQALQPVQVTFQPSPHYDGELHSPNILEQLTGDDHSDTQIIPDSVQARFGEVVFGFKVRRKDISLGQSDGPVYLPCSMVNCLDLAHRAFQMEQYLKDQVDELEANGRFLHEYTWRSYLVDRVSNDMPPKAAEDATISWKRFVSATIAGLIYGGLHLTAWGSPMPTTAKLLWRIASIYIALSGPFELPFEWLEGFIDDYNPRYNGSLFQSKRWLYRIIEYFGYIPTLIYIPARIFLVVECFINIRHLPASTFEVPLWSRYFPHIS
jgi:hypothetical protein